MRRELFLGDDNSSTSGCSDADPRLWRLALNYSKNRIAIEVLFFFFFTAAVHAHRNRCVLGYLHNPSTSKGGEATYGVCSMHILSQKKTVIEYLGLRKSREL